MYNRHCIFVLFFSFCIENLYAQDWLWAVSAGSTSLDNGFSIDVDQDDNIYVTGFYDDEISFGNHTLISKGGLDIFIVKYNTTGEAIWARSAGGTGDDVGFSIAVDPSGNVSLTGTFYSDSIYFDGVGLKNNGNADLFVAKYDGLGNLLWARTAGGSELDDAFGIATDGQANIYITGHFASSSMNFDSDTLTNSNPGFTEIYIIKFDAAGNIQWARTASGSNNDSAFSVVAGPSEDIYVTGFFRSLAIDFGQEQLINSAPARDMFITRYNADGEVVWAKSAGGELNDLGYAVRMISDERLGVSGSFRSDSIVFGNTVLQNTQPGSLDLFLTQYDTSGQVIGTTGGGGLQDDNGWCFASDLSSSLFLTGGYLSDDMIFGNDTLTNSGDSTYEIYLVKYHPDGQVLWTESIGGVENDYINWIRVGPSGDLYVIGSFESPSIQIGETILQNKGDGDLFLAKLSSISVGVQDHGKDHPDLIVYPNPANENFTIEFKNSNQDAHVELYNVFGEKLLERTIYGKGTLISGIDFQAVPGIYFIRVLEGNHQIVKKLLLRLKE